MSFDTYCACEESNKYSSKQDGSILHDTWAFLPVIANRFGKSPFFADIVSLDFYFWGTKMSFTKGNIEIGWLGSRTFGKIGTLKTITENASFFVNGRI